MILYAEVVPRREATSDQCRRLGAVLRRWFAQLLDGLAAVDPAADGWIDDAALDDLAAGEPPRPALLRLTGGVPGLVMRDARMALEAARAASPLGRKVLPSPIARSVPFGLSTTGDVRGQVVEALRCSLPRAVVDVIVIDGVRMAVCDDCG